MGLPIYKKKTPFDLLTLKRWRGPKPSPLKLVYRTRAIFTEKINFCMFGNGVLRNHGKSKSPDWQIIRNSNKNN